MRIALNVAPVTARLAAMLTGIDHVLIACADPDSAAAELEAAVGLRTSPGGRHEAQGTFNRLVWLGDSYVELMGVFDPELAEQSWWGRHALAVIGRAPDRAGYMGVVVASDDLSADAAVVRGRGSVLGPPEDGSRVRPDGRVVRWRLAHAASPDADLGLLFVIEHDRAGAEWSPAERAERAAMVHPLGSVARLERVEVPVANMQAATMRVHRDIGVGFRPSLSGGGARDGAVGRQTLRLLVGRAAVAPRVVIRAGSEARNVEVLGCRWLVEPEVGLG
jgi:hypothetical protein